MLASYETSLPSELRRRTIYEREAVIIVKKVHQQLEQLIIRSPTIIIIARPRAWARRQA